MIFEQLFDVESSTYTYLIGDGGVAALVDPVREQIERDQERLKALGLKLIHTVETHIHADHVTSGNLLAEKLGSLPVLHAESPVACQALRVRHGDRFSIGGIEIAVLETPGHTPESLSFLFAGRVLTGDSLLIGTCGRTDFQGGDAGVLWDSVHARLFTLADETQVYPGHDYKGRKHSTIGDEKRANTRLVGRTKDEFIQLMASLGLPRPKHIDEALPANLRCGKPDPQGA
jgi:glyoxylase-like metal-dependent hydrolase (beta-lactamase superfamily II)